MKVGIDDYIPATGAKAADLDALPREPLDPDGPYLVSGGRLCRRRRTKDATLIDPLCNFVAKVTEEQVLDDGAETSRVFIIEGHLDTGQPFPPVRVPAARFGAMNWVSEGWGLRAVVRAGTSTRDCLREAIQSLSPDARSRYKFTHTGWREVGGHWAYLTSSGAIGHDGCEVDLGPDLARYDLPRVPQDAAAAMRASLDLLTMAPLRVTAPLFAGTFRAPLIHAHPMDASLWIEGQTGSLKSTLAGLFLSHYGAFDRLHLPGTWSSTANQLERRSFLLKDALFVVDDYAPGGADTRELELKAARLLRAQGNLAGRGRLRADLTERPAFPPRGLIIATGEQHPPGQSILARAVVLELDREKVNLTAVTFAQQQAAVLPHAMAGYVAWLAPQMATLPATLRRTFAEVRTRATADGDHLRIPEALAHLWLGIDCGLAYATDIGACGRGEADEHRAAAWEALLGIGRAQGQLVEEERPSHRFLKVLHTLVTQRRGALLRRDDAGDSNRSGDLLGWQDEEALYLIPEAAWYAVTRFCRDTGELFPTREERLKRDMAKEGLADSDPGRHTASVRIAGRTRRVLRIKRALAEQVVGEEFPSPTITTVTGAGA